MSEAIDGAARVQARETAQQSAQRGLVRLYGAAGLARLQAAHVMVVGVGGVGSWAAEALVRSGVGRLTLVDLDEICVSNTNRQLHTDSTTIGRAKAEVLAERCRRIAPWAEVRAEVAFFTAKTAEPLLADRPDFVLDAIDSVKNKAVLIEHCLRAQIPVAVSGGAGGRRDPTALCRGDLGESGHDGLLRNLRRRLREALELPSGQLYGVRAVWSKERQVWPTGDGCVTTTPPQGARTQKLDCVEGFGAATMVTGAFGFALAAEVVEAIIAAE